jgi:hypothetical protein
VNLTDARHLRDLHRVDNPTVDWVVDECVPGYFVVLDRTYAAPDHIREDPMSAIVRADTPIHFVGRRGDQWEETIAADIPVEPVAQLNGKVGFWLAGLYAWCDTGGVKTEDKRRVRLCPVCERPNGTKGHLCAKCRTAEQGRP